MELTQSGLGLRLEAEEAVHLGSGLCCSALGSAKQLLECGLPAGEPADSLWHCVPAGLLTVARLGQAAAMRTLSWRAAAAEKSTRRQQFEYGLKLCKCTHSHETKQHSRTDIITQQSKEKCALPPPPPAAPARRHSDVQAELWKWLSRHIRLLVVLSLALHEERAGCNQG